MSPNTHQNWPEVNAIEDVASGDPGLLRIPVDFGDGDGTVLSLFILRGSEDGPVFHLLAGQHGNELNGCAALDAFIQQLDLSELKGTVLAVPVANPVCVAEGRQYPEFDDGSQKNMNLLWPGRPDGTYIERLAWAIWENGLSDCDWCLDLHSWKRWQAPAALFSRDGDALVPMGRASGLSVVRILDAFPLDKYVGYAPTIARRLGHAIGYAIELSGQQRVFPDQVELGCRAIQNLLKHAGMLPGEPEIPRQVNIAEAREVEVRSPSDAVFLPLVMPGDEISEGRPFARLLRHDTGRPDLLTSPVDGVVFKLGPLDQIQEAMDSEAGTGRDRYDRDFSGPVRGNELVAVIYEWEGEP
ncbi:MAG: succinylglutamate desuccinylase/aspartoacylase family protein [Planctomycetota bacterium]|jgi:predicted deacylase|nr:succinylglutamate desuccinylase/aspartoacylase family protein [Planctomycetota bacterium]